MFQFLNPRQWQPTEVQGRSHWGGGGGAGLTSTPEPKKVQKFQFQTSGMLLFTDVQKLYGPEISKLLPCMPQLLDILWRLSNFRHFF